MSYEALARKYRPRSFEDVVGQPHVVRALSNALESGRIHHAFLFTGTRGVGKTTLARILAKALNCDEKGTSAEPCGECSACVGIDEGRYFDLIEVDAASRTKVDDTRELLDNVQYAPTHGQYKIYLIDEVHMLTGHSFNALLKTLEEPPAHVKFLLATTDPQKLPVTVLSRCLQFNLRALDVVQIRGRLAEITKKENVAADDQGIELIARGGNGSMRDALSLLDQAIAYGDGQVDAASVRDMLGLIEDHITVGLLEALSQSDAEAVMQQVSSLAERASDYLSATDELLLALNEIAIHQQAPEALTKSGRDPERFAQLAPQMSAQDVQLFYQTGLIAKRDIALAPDPRSGFEMMLLRMLAFRPADSVDTLAVAPVASTTSATTETGQGASLNPPSQQQTQPPTSATMHQPAPDRLGADGKQPGGMDAGDAAPIAGVNHDATPSTQIKLDSAQALLAPQMWRQLVESSPLRGLSRELAMNISPAAIDEARGRLNASIDSASRHLMNDGRKRSVEKVISDATGTDIVLDLSVSDRVADTPAGAQMLEQKERERGAEVTIATDPAVRALGERFDATIVPDSIIPAKEE